MEPQWQEFNGATQDFPYRDLLNEFKQSMVYVKLSRPLLDRNIFYEEKQKKEEPFIITYKSKQIRGITLELWGKNPRYNW